jgi:hypothetical protein
MNSKRFAKQSQRSPGSPKNSDSLPALGQISKTAQEAKSPFRYNFNPKNLCHWSFDECPKEELFTCWHYEYLRDCPAVIDRVLEWREKQKEHPEDTLEYFMGDPLERVIAQWPTLPYLEIPEDERQLYQKIRNILGSSIREILLGEQAKKKELAAFLIRDWSASDAELIKQFKKWLKAERPKECVIRESRGRPSRNSNVSVWLKALGAYRLSRVMSQNEVIGYAEGFGRHLYENQPQLSRVLKRTASYLVWLDQT